MKSFSLQVGTLFELDRVAHRIERIHDADQVVLLRLHDGKTILKTQKELLDAYVAGDIDAAQDAYPAKRQLPCAPLSTLTDVQMQELKRRRAYVQALIDEGDFTFEPEFIEPFIRSIAEKIKDPSPPSRATLWRWHARFNAFRDLRALVPLFDRRGSRTSRQDARVLELLTDSVNAAFKASPKATGRDVHDRLAGKIQDENRRRLPDEQLTVPNKRTTYRLLGKIDAYDQVVLHEGQASADRRYRMVKQGPRTSGILERVEADHTPLDLFLIDENTWLPLGRPTLTLFIDHYSRFPLGYYLSFGGTSATAVMGALRHSILPKQRAAEVIPQLHVEHDWPCYGRMDVLVLDNGLEFHGFDLESVALDLMIRLQYCPKRTPRFKGVIERFLKTINYFFAHQLPGSSMAKLADRGDYDPQKHALLTLGEFKHLLEKWLLDVYAQTVHRGIGTTPWMRWHDGAARRALELPSSMSTLQQRIGLVRERKLRADGLLLEGIRYSDDSLLPMLKKWGPGTKVRVVFDAEDLSDIQVWGPEETDPVTVLALDQSYARGLTLIQHQLIKQQVRAAGQDAEDPQALITAKHQIAIALEEMVLSRKQRTRRKAAKGHGITSSKPQGRLSAQEPTEHVASPTAASTGPDHQKDSPPPMLQSFRMNLNGR